MKLEKLLFVFLLVGVLGVGCTDLEEEIRDAQTNDDGVPDVGALLSGVYDNMRLPYMDQSRFWAAQQHTSDETIGPTRGPDWDDNGIWRVLHNHTWDADHLFLGNTFNELLAIVYNASVIVQESTSTPQQVAEARFLRAFAMFSVLDGWNQVPFRNDLIDFSKDPEVFVGVDAMDFIISEVEAVRADLPDGPAYRANKDAAAVLLMKAYLNRGTIEDRTAPKFDGADMNQVISLADGIINSGKYSLSPSVFDNTAPNNDQISSENIFTGENRGGESSGNVRSRWFCTLHYNQNPSGWNGFTTIADFYNKFEDQDSRKGGDYPGMTNVSGIKAGFLVGQQVDQDGNALTDRGGNPLSYTEEVALTETGSNLEVTGIRVIKYPIDYNSGDNADNDYVFYRFADVWLMKAEAEFRNGNSGMALDMINTLRTARGASALGSVTADDIIDERGRELY